MPTCFRRFFCSATQDVTLLEVLTATLVAACFEILFPKVIPAEWEEMHLQGSQSWSLWEWHGHDRKAAWAASCFRRSDRAAGNEPYEFEIASRCHAA